MCVHKKGCIPYLVHRLTNPEDRELVEKAAGDLDRSAASFIPTLAAGQAILIGIDFPIPVTLQMLKPDNPPASSGPKYQASWCIDVKDREEST
jgi:DNA helicase HerA-like ATPase